MSDTLQFSWHSTPAQWACYWDPEGAVGYGKTKAEALRSLWDSCDGAPRHRCEDTLLDAIVAAIEKQQSSDRGVKLDVIRVDASTELRPEGSGWAYWINGDRFRRLNEQEAALVTAALQATSPPTNCGGSDTPRTDALEASCSANYRVVAREAYDHARALERELAAEKRRADLWTHPRVRIVYWPHPSNPVGTYPIEHAPSANKDGRALIEAAMAADAKFGQGHARGKES